MLIATSPKDEFLQQTEYILAKVVETGNFNIGFEFVDSLLAGRDTIDSSVALVLDGMEKVWNPLEHEGEKFLDAAIRMTRLDPSSVTRHTRIQGLLNSGSIPEELRPRFQSAGQKSLIQVANVVGEGYELDQEDWLRIHEKVEDDRFVAKVIREITGRPPRSNFVDLFYDEHGIAYSYVNGRVVEVGRFNQDDDPDVVKAIEVWKARSRMTPKVNR